MGNFLKFFEKFAKVRPAQASPGQPRPGQPSPGQPMRQQFGLNPSSINRIKLIWKKWCNSYAWLPVWNVVGPALCLFSDVRAPLLFFCEFNVGKIPPPPPPPTLAPPVPPLGTTEPPGDDCFVAWVWLCLARWAPAQASPAQASPWGNNLAWLHHL